MLSGGLDGRVAPDATIVRRRGSGRRHGGHLILRRSYLDDLSASDVGPGYLVLSGALQLHSDFPWIDYFQPRHPCAACVPGDEEAHRRFLDSVRSQPVGLGSHLDNDPCLRRPTDGSIPNQRSPNVPDGDAGRTRVENEVVNQRRVPLDDDAVLDRVLDPVADDGNVLTVAPDDDACEVVSNVVPLDDGVVVSGGGNPRGRCRHRHSP